MAPETPQADAADVVTQIRAMRDRVDEMVDGCREATQAYERLCQAVGAPFRSPLADGVKRGWEHGAQHRSALCGAENMIRRLSAELQAAKEALRSAGVGFKCVIEAAEHEGTAECHEIARRALADVDSALSASPATIPARAAVPEGWKLVPLEPIEEMLDALFSRPPGLGVHHPARLACYHDMLAASPSPDTPSAEASR